MLVRIAAASDELATIGEQALDRIITMRKLLRRRGIASEEAVLNVFELCSLVYLDLACLLSDVFKYDQTPKARTYFRLLILTLHETSRVLPKLLQPSVRHRLVEWLGPDVDHPLKQVHSGLSTLRNHIEQSFGDIRNGIVAHLDSDADYRLLLLNRIDSEKTIQLAIELVTYMLQLSGFFHKYLDVALPALQTQEHS